MATQAELFLNFPDDTQVQQVCKVGRGPARCRFLGGGRTPNDPYICAKAGWLRTSIDNVVKSGIVGFQPDNCPGPLGLVADNQQALVGDGLISAKTWAGDGSRQESRFERIILEEGKVTIGQIKEAPEERVRVWIDPRAITFVWRDERDSAHGKVFHTEEILFDSAEATE